MNVPPQGPIRPDQSFDSWCLAGMLIQAENERDRIQDAAWRHKHEGPSAPSAYLCAATVAWARTRASIEDRARQVALGYCSLDWACCVICSDCPEHHEQMIEDLRREVGLYRIAIDRQVTAIERRVLLLCGNRAPGEQIIAAAETVPGPLPRQRILALCQRIAATTQRTRKRRAYA